MPYIIVESTVRDAFNGGYDVILVSDCVSSRNSKHHQSALDQVGEAIGLVVSSNESPQIDENEGPGVVSCAGQGKAR